MEVLSNRGYLPEPIPHSDLPQNYFAPRPAANQTAFEASSLFDEAVIVPFKSDQIEAFIIQFMMIVPSGVQKRTCLT